MLACLVLEPFLALPTPRADAPVPSFEKMLPQSHP